MRDNELVVSKLAVKVVEVSADGVMLMVELVRVYLVPPVVGE